jgi:hypothetical protein
LTARHCIVGNAPDEALSVKLIGIDPRIVESIFVPKDSRRDMAVAICKSPVNGRPNSGSTRKWRIKQAKEHLGPLYKRSRRYSKGRDDGYSSVAFVCGYWDANSQPPRWRILAQETTSEDGQLILQGVRPLW